MSQMLLIPDPRPLDERLGQKFFRQAPKKAGVYLMRDAQDRVLYVGKAKNLRQRLQNYRIANPDRMPRRHLRMLRQVMRIEFQFCPGESAALKHESKLLRSLKPRFNRAGVWPGKTKFLVWRRIDERVELNIADVPETGWQRFGPLGSNAGRLLQTLATVLWLATNPSRMLTELPSGWAQGRFTEIISIQCGRILAEVLAGLESFFWVSPDDLLLWLGTQFSTRTHLFERRVIDAEMEILKDFAAKNKPAQTHRHQLALL